MSTKYNETTGSQFEPMNGMGNGEKERNKERLEKKIGSNKRKAFSIDNLISEEKHQIGKSSPSPPNFATNGNHLNESHIVTSNLSSASSPIATNSNSPISSTSSSSFKSKSYCSNNAFNMGQSRSLSPSNNFHNSSSSSQNGQMMWNPNPNFLPNQMPNQIQSQLGPQIPQMMGQSNSPNSFPFFAQQAQFPSDPQLSALHFHLQREQAFNMIRNSNRIFDPRFSLPCKQQNQNLFESISI